MNGGSGDDEFYITGNDVGHDVFNGGTGYDQIVVYGDIAVSNFRLTSANVSNIEALYFQSGDIISGTSGADIFDFSGISDFTGYYSGISLGGGNDSYTGSGDRDEVYGGSGRDTIGGGVGSDTLDGGDELAPFQRDRADTAERLTKKEQTRTVAAAQEMTQELARLGLRTGFEIYPDETHMSVLPVAVNRAIRCAFSLSGDIPGAEVR